MLEITWRRSARDSFLNAVSRLCNLATCASSSSLFSGNALGRFDGDGGAVGRRCGEEWRARKMAPTRVILMSCGSYNPPTNMHLRMFGTYISICRHPHPVAIERQILSRHVALSRRCHACSLFITYFRTGVFLFFFYFLNSSFFSCLMLIIDRLIVNIRI